MHRAAVLCFVILALIAPVGAAQTPRKTVMVVDFEDLVKGWSSTREIVTARVIARLREEQAIRVLPRERVQEALQQARVETAGYLDWEDAQKVARSLEADYVLMGQIAAFDQQSQSAYVPLVGSVHTVTATVNLRGRILDVAAGRFVGEPKAEVKRQQTGGSAWVGPWWGHVSVSNFDSQLIGKATLEAVEKLVADAKPALLK